MAIVRLPNQGDFEIPDELVHLPEETQAARTQRDSLVRHALAFAPSALNASLTYKEENGRTVVIVTPQLGRKALDGPPFAAFHARLRAAPAYLDPALHLSWEIRWQLLGNRHPVDVLLTYRSRLEELVVGREREQWRREFGDLCTTLRAVEGTLPNVPLIGF